MAAARLLAVKDLYTRFHTEAGTVKAVDGISCHVDPGETLGIVGESGCGKTVTALSLMGLLPDPPGCVSSGAIHFDGREFSPQGPPERRGLRGRGAAMIFQEPMTSLNPVYTVGRQIAQVVRRHQGGGQREALGRAEEMLAMVGINNPGLRARQYPHELSGGMRQRVMIALALAAGPKLLIADEPTTALDVTIQAQILDLLQDLQERLGMAVILITHDLGVIAQMARRVLVMYAGKVMEEAPVEPLFARPLHPYTKGLLEAVPRLDMPRGHGLGTIPGTVPDPLAVPPGCPFHPRCFLADERCRTQEPPLQPVAGQRRTACWHWEKLLPGEGAA